MEYPQISIIIPVYNSEKTLRRCIDSILKQNYSNYEVIIINDGSSDESGNISEWYATNDHRIKVIHKKNGGVSSARNLGLKQAVGKWIAFCDSDDWVENDWLESYFLQGDKGGLIVQGYTKHPYQNYEKQLFYCQDNRKWILHDFTGYLNYAHKKENGGFLWCHLFRRDIIVQNSIIFNENLSLCEDFLFILDYLRFVNCVITIDATCYHYYEPNCIFKYKISIDNRYLCEMELKCSLLQLKGSTTSFLYYNSVNSLAGILVDMERDNDFERKDLKDEIRKIFIEDVKRAGILNLNLKAKIYYYLNYRQTSLTKWINSFLWKLLKK